MQRCSEGKNPSDRRARTGATREAQAERIRETSPQQWLQRTIETEIVPRLMLAHRMPAEAPPQPAPSTQSTSAEVERFTMLVITEDTEACEAFVRALRERGAGLEDIYLDLLAPAARRLGVLWEDDQCDFAQVTLGLWRLQNLVFDLSPLLPAPWTERPDGPRRAMLAAAPGSQHTLGLLMVSEFFRRAGWDVWTEPMAGAQDLVAAARDAWFDVIGLSIGGAAQVDSLASTVKSLRRASQNPSVGVMVGGPILLLQPELLVTVGADFTAPDARVAVEAAESFVAALGRSD
jgi:methanogenic corrinoid protein MtbC1